MADKVDMKISEDFDYLLGLEQKKVECKVKIADIYFDIQNHTNKIVELERERAEFQTQLLDVSHEIRILSQCLEIIKTTK